MENKNHVWNHQPEIQDIQGTPFCSQQKSEDLCE